MQEYIDSLVVELPKMKEDFKKVELLCNISIVYYSMDATKGLDYGTRTLVLSEKIKSKEGIAVSYLNKKSL